MKRFNFSLFFMVFLTVAFFTTVAYCGVWDSFKNNAIEGAITVFFVILSGLFGKKIMEYKKVVSDIYAAFREYKDSINEKSAGGKDITKEEWQAITARLVTAIEDSFAIIPIKWLPKKG